MTAGFIRVNAFVGHQDAKIEKKNTRVRIIPKAEKSKAGDLYFNFSVDFDRVIDSKNPKEVEIYMTGKKAYEDFQNWDMTSSNPEGTAVALIEAKETDAF